MYVTKVTNGPVGEGDGEWAVTGGLMKEGKGRKEALQIP